MTATDTEAMSALHELLDERQRYQGWLATLEGRRNSTPPHVYERVQRDYTGRLDRVMQTLAERAGQLTGTIENMTSELATLREHESDRTDERHEAELRAAVGEFTPDEWEQRRAEVDSEIERIAAERRSLEEELQELQRIVALTASIEPQATTPEPTAQASQQPQRDEAADTSAEAAAQREKAERMLAQASAPSIDDFVAEWHPPQVRPQQGNASRQQHDNIPDTKDLEGLVIPAAPMGGNPVGAAGADYGIANGVTGVAAGAGAAPAQTRTPPPVSAQSAEARRDADKTLKCPECGALNYATEWYCERCGGELSTF
jgi:predicted  nucleic acid-binding Zn-ribbon protein